MQSKQMEHPLNLIASRCKNESITINYPSYVMRDAVRLNVFTREYTIEDWFLDHLVSDINKKKSQMNRKF
jgi:hypothetical protein